MSESMPAGTAFAERVFRECLDAFSEVVFTVTGHCMRPDLAHGERVRVVSVSKRRPRFGDIVLTRRAGDVRLHRLVWRPRRAAARASWRTKADGAAFLDPRLSREDVVGTVVAVAGRAYRRRPVRALRSLLQAVASRARAAVRERRRPSR